MNKKLIKFIKGVLYVRYSQVTGFELLEVDEIVKNTLYQKSLKDYDLDELQEARHLLDFLLYEKGIDIDEEYEFWKIKKEKVQNLSDRILSAGNNPSSLFVGMRTDFC